MNVRMISLLVMNWLSNGSCGSLVCSCPFVLFVSRYPGLRETMTGTCVIHGVYTYEGRRIYEYTFEDIAVLFGDLTELEILVLDLFFLSGHLGIDETRPPLTESCYTADISSRIAT
jgi:hypothetical protein